MKVDPKKPFRLIFSLYQHEYLGYLFESFVIQINEKGNLTLTNQNISAKNAAEFHILPDSEEYQLIQTMDSMQQDAIVQHFSKKKTNVPEFLAKARENEDLTKEIHKYLERRRSKILPLLHGKHVYEMGIDGEPAWRKINVLSEKASILFHFFKNEDNTHYFPTIKLRGQKLEFKDGVTYIIASDPAWVMVNNELFTFKQEITGGKLQPFLRKKFIMVPKSMEDQYYEKFIKPLVATYDVSAKGFEIRDISPKPRPVLMLSEVKAGSNNDTGLFTTENTSEEKKTSILFELSYEYDAFRFKADNINEVSVSLEKENDSYVFHRISRDIQKEIAFINQLKETGLMIRNSRYLLPESQAFDWINLYREKLVEDGYDIRQTKSGGKTYYLGPSSIQISIEEKIDWFDIKAVALFGRFEIPIATIRAAIIQNKNEIKLPNGEIGIIPASWTEQYKDLFMFSDMQGDEVQLKRHHIALVHTLQESNMAQVSMSRKLQRLLDYTQIEDYEMPAKFNGDLRPYQKAGYNWMCFLNDYALGGCLADDMGLGKTVQTLAILQREAELLPGSTSLLVMPTSLIYNWEKEAARFAPNLKILTYTGSFRNKDPKQFGQYDLVLTSYGITRIDTELLASFYFNYIVLDESQAIKNPDSVTAKSVYQLKSRRRLILTGTPIENSTLDLWSQLTFVNPGLLGSQSYFKKEYLIPIEKKHDEGRTLRLNAMIKPFILRRDKQQVAGDLPEKTISIKYCDMLPEQKEFYEREKNKYRNEILDSIQVNGIQKSQMILLQGLTRLRQIANHPVMVEPDYQGGSGKLEDIDYMIQNALTKDHKILIFSQFVKHLKLVATMLDKQNLPYAYLDGATKDRQEQVEKFQKNDDIHLFLISLKAGGLGLNLTKADYVFLLDPWWNPAIEAQAIDRAHRIGQENKVFGYKFIARDTLEEKILLLQDKKMKLAGDLISIEESFVKSLTQDDIQKLFT